MWGDYESRDTLILVTKETSLSKSLSRRVWLSFILTERKQRMLKVNSELRKVPEEARLRKKMNKERKNLWVKNCNYYDKCSQGESEKEVFP